jgi:hypothetical protein
MIGPREWIPARLVRAVLDVRERARAVGDAIWLHLYLLLEADHQGRLCRKSERIAADLGVEESDVQAWLKRLVDVGLVTVLSPSPFLVTKLPRWSGSRTVAAPGQAIASSPSGSGEEDVPVSSSSAAAASSNHGEDGGRGEGEELLREVLAVLDETDPDEFRGLIVRFPAETVRNALRRVQATPAGQIRKSKTALFRYLLGRLS